MIKKVINSIILLCLSVFLGNFIWQNSPLCSNYYANKGKVLYDNGQYDSSINFFERSLQANPKNTSARYFYVLALTKGTPTYSHQQSLYLMANSKTNDLAQNYAKSQIYQLKERLISGLEDNYIYSAVLNKDIIRWNTESFPLKVYIDLESSPGSTYTENIKKAFSQWSIESKFLQFTQVYKPEECDIEIKFTDYNGPKCTSANCKYVLAVTTNKTDEFNRLTKMIITFYRNNPFGEEITDTQIYNTALHEIGHALGIAGHSDNPDDVMYANNDSVDPYLLYFGGGKIYLSKRDLNTITLLYRIAPTITNTKGWYYENLYYAPLILGNDEEILKKKLDEYQTYINNYPNYCGGYINIASLYSSMGNNDKAQKALDKAEELATNNDEKYLINYNRSILYYNIQDYNSALDYAKKAQTIKDDDTVKSLLHDIEIAKNL